MRLTTLWIIRKDDDMPELIDAWDEFSAEGNYDGMEASFEKAKASIGSELAQWRIIDMVVDGHAIEQAFAPAVVAATTPGAQ